jgi:hypothetical protein
MRSLVRSRVFVTRRVPSRTSALAALLLAPLSFGLAGCGAPGADGGELVSTVRSEIALASPVSRGANFETPASSIGDLGIVSGVASASLLFGGGAPAPSTKTFDLDAARPATLEHLNLGSGGDANWGDFDGDGRAEMVIGAELMTTPGVFPTGGFIVVHFTATGAFASADYVPITADASPGVYTQWGHKVVVGDFNGDGYDDLAISGFTERVRVYRGSASGLSYKWNTTWTGGYGREMAAGDFNCDGVEDLAIAAYERDGDGEVAVFTGVAGGSLTYRFALRQPSGQRISGDLFGYSLAAGNFNGDSVGGRPCVDLAVGIPNKSVSGFGGAGQVNVYYGANTTNGLAAGNFAALNQDVAGVSDNAEAGDQFGSSVVASDLNGDGTDDLATIVNDEYQGGACAYDSGVQLFAGQAGVGILPSTNRLFRLTGYRPRLGGSQKNKLAVAMYSDLSNAGTTCSDNRVRVYNFANTPATSQFSLSQSTDYTGGTLGVPAGGYFGASLTHARPGYVR